MCPQPTALSESTPLLPQRPPTSSSSSGSDTDNECPPPLPPAVLSFKRSELPPPRGSHKQLAVISEHEGPVSSLALCGEFLLSASLSRDIVAWQQPDLRRFAKFGHGEGSVKALAAAGNRVFTAHQDRRVRVWRVSRASENVFKLAATLPTPRDYLGRFLKQSNYVQTRRNHRKLWIEHADSISCLAVHGGLVYSGSWDKTLKVWRASDLRCVESIRAHDDAVNALAVRDGAVFSASADGSIKVWERAEEAHRLKCELKGGGGGGFGSSNSKGMSWNAVVVASGGRFVYGGGSDGRITGWERGEGEWRVACEVRRAHEAAVLCLCEAGEAVLCSGSADRSVGVWRRRRTTIERVAVLRGHEGPVKCLQGARCGNGGYLLYSGGMDKTLRVWWLPVEKEESDPDAGGDGDEVKEESRTGRK